jgi:glucose-6-phosphate isomerase, archaeal
MKINLENLKPDIRHLNDMREILYDKKWGKTADNFELYYMYRGVERNNDLRYDITIIPAKMLGSEFVKTKGHYHLENWQETYTVLEGNAIYLMQKRKSDNEIEDVYAVKAQKGESIIILPGYGHVTINPSKTQELKMANWSSENCKMDYLPYEKLQGACYYYTQNGWIKNENYKSVPELRFEKPLKSLPKNLNFLKG